MKPDAQLRPLQVGEIVDRAATFWRRRIWTLFQLALGFQIVNYAVAKAYQLAVDHYVPIFRDPQRLVDAARSGFSPELMRQALVAISAGFALTLLILLTSWMANAVSADFAVNEQLGRPASISGAFKRLFRRFPTLFGVFALGHLWAGVVFVLSLIPGTALVVIGALLSTGSQVAGVALLVGGAVLLGLGTLFVLLWYVLRFMATPVVVMVEDGGVWRSFLRSSGIVRGRVAAGFMGLQFVRATLVLTVILLVLIVVGTVTSLPALLVQSVFGNIFDPQNADPSKIPQALLIPAELFELSAGALIVPLSHALSAFFYLDARMRREGLDLEVKLDALARRMAA